MEQKRISAKLKTEVVLSLLRGESAEEMSRKHGVTMADIAQWRDEFIANDTQGFKKNPEESKLARAESRIGHLEMELDLVNKERVGGETKKEIVAILSEERYEKTGKKYPIRLRLKFVGCSSGNWYQAKSDTNENVKRGR